jgi:hypothetical protein
MRMESHLHEVGDHSVNDVFQPIDPRTSREAAWRAVERGFICPDPSFGAGLDEDEFSPPANHKNVEGFSIP